jgi:hypothetical protein
MRQQTLSIYGYGTQDKGLKRKPPNSGLETVGRNWFTDFVTLKREY